MFSKFFLYFSLFLQPLTLIDSPNLTIIICFLWTYWCHLKQFSLILTVNEASLGCRVSFMVMLNVKLNILILTMLTYRTIFDGPTLEYIKVKEDWPLLWCWAQPCCHQHWHNFGPVQGTKLVLCLACPNWSWPCYHLYQNEVLYAPELGIMFLWWFPTIITVDICCRLSFAHSPIQGFEWQLP